MVQHGESQQNRVVLSVLVMSLIVIGIGICWAYSIGMENSRLYHDVYHAEEHITELRRLASTELPRNWKN